MPKTTPKILNLSPYNSSNIQLSVFCLGTKFTWTKSGLLNYKNDLSNFTKKIQIKGIFNDTEYEDESIVRNESTRNFESKSRELLLIINEIENLTPNVISYKSNFTQEEYSVLQYLKGNQDIVFKTADKGGGWVIMDKNYYWVKTVKEHLLSNVYKEVSVYIDKKVFKNLKKHVKKIWIYINEERNRLSNKC